MNKKLKIFLWIILILVIIIVAYTIYVWIFSTCCGPKLASIASIKDQRLADPNLLYASFWWSGLCGDGKGDTGGCYSEMYLYSTGKFVKESGFVHYDSARDIIPVIERNFTAIITEQIIQKIKDSDVMNKDCPSNQIMDAGWDYQINISGVKKSFSNPPPDCKDAFDKIDDLIDSILNYKE